MQSQVCRADNRWKPTIGCAIFIAGLVTFVAVQMALTAGPLRGWPLFPEADDTLTYILKTKQMEECFRQDCPALNDLRGQLLVSTGDPDADRQRYLAASKVFPVNHPLFSAVLLGIARLGLSIPEAYRFVWILGPLIFGLAFAYLLAVLFGRAPAGMALALLAFKVFPDTGLHHVVPSNLTMAVAVAVWARVIARRGDAPWVMPAGALVLVAMHPVGRIYSVMALALALALAGFRARPRIRAALAATAAVVALAFVVPMLIDRPSMFTPSLLPSEGNPVAAILAGAAKSARQVVEDVVRLDRGLFGLAPVFLPALVLGAATMGRDARRRMRKVLLVQAAFVGLLFFYVSNHPADVILRIWIPLVVILFGLVGQALWASLAAAWNWRFARTAAADTDAELVLAGPWSAVAFAVLAGYAADMMTHGGEQIVATARYLRERQPLVFAAAQPQILLNRARAGDRVLYTSFTVMPYFFNEGAMGLGAVFYHPSFAGDAGVRAWLERPDLRFAAAYNPLVYHPSFEGVDEHKWWITSPSFRAVSLSAGRRHGPFSKDGKLRAGDFQWLDIFPGDSPAEDIEILVDNPAGESRLTMNVLGRDGEPLAGAPAALDVPAFGEHWLIAAFGRSPKASGVRLAFPAAPAAYAIKGVRFGATGGLWPWAPGARMKLAPREGPGASVSFDPADLVPEPLKKARLTILNDEGSSVLLQIDRD